MGCFHIISCPSSGHAHYSLYLIQGAKLLLFPEITKYFLVFFRNIGDLDVCVYINKVENDLLEW